MTTEKTRKKPVLLWMDLARTFLLNPGCHNTEQKLDTSGLCTTPYLCDRISTRTSLTL